jgi:hypothetical protein
MYSFFVGTTNFQIEFLTFEIGIKTLQFLTSHSDFHMLRGILNFRAFTQCLPFLVRPSFIITIVIKRYKGRTIVFSTRMHIMLHLN